MSIVLLGIIYLGLFLLKQPIFLSKKQLFFCPLFRGSISAGGRGSIWNGGRGSVSSGGRGSFYVDFPISPMTLNFGYNI